MALGCPAVSATRVLERPRATISFAIAAEREKTFAMLIDPQQIRIVIREATAFVGHSFADEDEKLVEQIKEFLSKLGVKCDSGKRPEPRGISDKIKERIHAAELFVGIFTRHLRQEDGSYSTSAWIVDEKATALAAGKRLLLFVENGVREFGGLQGDYEYIEFERADLGQALIRAMDYVLAITSMPVMARVDGQRMHLEFEAKTSPAKYKEELEKFLKDYPKDINARLSLATLIGKMQDRSAGVAELRKLAAEFPNVARVHHQLGHELQHLGDLPAALLSFQRALDLSAADYANHRCYGRCLQQHAVTFADAVVNELGKSASSASASSCHWWSSEAAGNRRRPFCARRSAPRSARWGEFGQKLAGLDGKRVARFAGRQEMAFPA
jgi:tetratricopeptide (TPR) repeat protein